ATSVPPPHKWYPPARVIRSCWLCPADRAPAKACPSSRAPRRGPAVVVVVPINAHVHKAQHVAQEDGQQWPQRRKVVAVRYLEFQHHDSEDDGEHAIAEGFEAGFMHSSGCWVIEVLSEGW
nr:hypothetical protein [Tanacetum cinerariifolium]